jgi:hypothetical protein
VEDELDFGDGKVSDTLRFYDYNEKKGIAEFNAKRSDCHFRSHVTGLHFSGQRGDNEVWTFVNSVITANILDDALWCGRVRVGM